MSDYSNIANYILREDIGEGNFGKVKLGIFKQTGEEFAIKILNKKKIKIKMKNTVFKENEIITKFNHINVIFVLDIIEDPENYYIVMEYCKSGELFDYIVDKQHLEEDEAAIFFYQLINGVEYVHSLGIAHRDLKPENLLLTEQKVLKIIDFGLSHEFNGEDFLKTKCGSPSYAAPEIIKGLPYDGFKTDIWCCGIILYAMVCGYLPFEGENNKILFKNIVECNPEIPDNLSEETQELISAILRADPDERITIDEIKNHDFYLRGKELCNIDYQKLQKQLNKRRKNKSNNNYSKNFDKMTDDVEFINQRINITIDNDDNEQYDDIMKINMKNSSNNSNNNSKNDSNKNNKENNEDINNNENQENENNDNNEIVIKSLRSIHEINSSKITNNSKNENKININNNEKGKSNKKVKEEEKNEEPRRHFKFINRRTGLNAFRDKIFSLNKNINKKLENFNNNMNIILNTDVNSIVNNKINKNPLYNNQLFNNNKNNKNNLNININQNNDIDNNANTVSSTIHGNQKNIFTNFIYSNNNNTNRNDYNNFININNKKKSIFLDNISSNSKNRKITIQEKDKNRITPRKIKDNNNNNFPIFKNIQANHINIQKANNKYNKAFSGLNRKFKNANIIKINNNNFSKGKIQNNNNIKNNINIINNINNTINNYGILNILSTINNNNINNNLRNNKSNKKSKISLDKVEKLKTEGNTFNAIKEIMYNQKRRVNSSYKIKKLNDNYQNKYLNNNIAKDYHSTKSSNSGSKNNRSNFGSNSKSKNKKTKNTSNIIGNNYKKGFIINNINVNNNKVNKNNYMQYPILNVGNKLFADRGSSNRAPSNYNVINKNKNDDYISITGNNSKRNKPFYKRSNNFENKLENRIINNKNVIKNNSSEKANNKKECINYFNALSTMFMKTENNFHKNKFQNSNTNSINSRVSKNSKNSKKSKATSKNSKSSKSSKNSNKKYNLIRNAIKNQMNNFIFNKKGGSEGKTNRFIQHSKLFNINNFRNNNYNNINNILNNCMGINNDLNKNINTNNNRNNEVNNIKIIKHKGNKFKKIIYNQINFENLKNIYDLNKKKN